MLTAACKVKTSPRFAVSQYTIVNIHIYGVNLYNDIGYSIQQLVRCDGRYWYATHRQLVFSWFAIGSLVIC